MLKKKELALKTIAATSLGVAIFTMAPFTSNAQFTGGEDIPFNEGPPPPTFTPPPPPPTPPPIPNTPPPTFTPPPPNNPFVPPVVVPTDVTQTSSFPGFSPVFTENGLASPAIRGVEQLSLNEFPAQNPRRSKNSKIFVFPKSDGEDVIYKKLSPSVVKLNVGEVLAACRRPSRIGHIETKFGSIAVLPNSSVLIGYHSNLLRITNTNALGKRLRVFLNTGPFAGDAKRVISLKPGYELVVSNSRLTRANLRPNDGIARRHFQVLEKGHLAVSEVSVESIVKSSDLIANLRQNINGVNERRILGDMSKMAAVLNHMNGTQGFTVTPRARLAQTQSGIR